VFIALNEGMFPIVQSLAAQEGSELASASIRVTR
jgi:hypothetical protein